MPTYFHRPWAAAFALLVMPVLMGSSGNCGFALDFTETFLVTDPVERIVIDVGDGNLDATAYMRDAILLKRHTFGFQSQLGSPEYTVEDGELRFAARCKTRHECTHDHLFELPLGIGFEVEMDDARIDLGYIDRDIGARFVTGSFTGTRLRSPRVVLAAELAEISVDFASAPESVQIELQEGSVALQVPAGSYHCEVASAAGEVTITDIVCDDAADAVLDVQVGSGDIVVSGAAP